MSFREKRSGRVPSSPLRHQTESACRWHQNFQCATCTLSLHYLEFGQFGAKEEHGTLWNDPRQNHRSSRVWRDHVVLGRGMASGDSTPWFWGQPGCGQTGAGLHKLHTFHHVPSSSPKSKVASSQTLLQATRHTEPFEAAGSRLFWPKKAAVSYGQPNMLCS